jgi:hypothetical protein
LPLLPPKSPELNPVENVIRSKTSGNFSARTIRQNKLANRIFGGYEASVAAACDAWNSRLADPARIASIETRQCATIAHNYGRLGIRAPNKTLVTLNKSKG